MSSSGSGSGRSGERSSLQSHASKEPCGRVVTPGGGSAHQPPSISARPRLSIAAPTGDAPATRQHSAPPQHSTLSSHGHKPQPARTRWRKPDKRRRVPHALQAAVSLPPHARLYTLSGDGCCRTRAVLLRDKPAVCCWESSLAPAVVGGGGLLETAGAVVVGVSWCRGCWRARGSSRRTRRCPSRGCCGCDSPRRCRRRSP